jgi:proline dehydrogenase
MFDAASKSFFHALARSPRLARFASRYGMAKPTSFARRFIAGETLEEAIGAARGVQALGMTLTLDLLGESVTTAAEAQAATRTYLGIIQQIVDAGIDRNISLKLTQLGLDIDPAACLVNVRQILELAARHSVFVRVDMENSPYTQLTLDLIKTVWQSGIRNTGAALQSALMRSESDVKDMNALGIRVRLMKGAYKEPRTVAYQAKSDVDAAFVRIMQSLLADGNYPAIATHDPNMIEATKAFARDRGISLDRFEFQMLFGIRRDLQARLVKEGYRMRVYLPYGTQWYPYFMRRLGERPANVGFVLKGVLKDL